MVAFQNGGRCVSNGAEIISRAVAEASLPRTAMTRRRRAEHSLCEHCHDSRAVTCLVLRRLAHPRRGSPCLPCRDEPDHAKPRVALPRRPSPTTSHRAVPNHAGHCHDCQDATRLAMRNRASTSLASPGRPRPATIWRNNSIYCTTVSIAAITSANSCKCLYRCRNAESSSYAF